MSHGELPADFSGVVRLFPLPNVVLFPHMILPLHIYEPRYCELLAEALANEQLITLALLRPGWEPDYEKRPPLFDTVCIAEIVAHEALPHKRHNVLLRGLQRAKITSELTVTTSFRQAQVTLFQEIPSEQHDTATANTLTKILDLFRNILPESEIWDQQLDQLLSRPLDLGLLTDIVAYTANFPAEVKQQLLAEVNCHTRADMIIKLLHTQMRKRQQADDANNALFPPPFSDN